VISPSILVAMGVCGSGKTTIGQGVAAALGWPFQDADALHPRANIDKMAAGHPLDDADRAPWLAALRGWIVQLLAQGGHGVLAASLLKRRYRDQVIGGDARVALVYLHGDAALLRARMGARRGHFMSSAMLDSQLAALEPPGAGERCIAVDVGGDVACVVRGVLGALDLPAVDGGGR
jgi:carbohydrate kinase (thermoresistant glucokinase family)